MAGFAFVLVVALAHLGVSASITVVGQVFNLAVQVKNLSYDGAIHSAQVLIECPIAAINRANALATLGSYGHACAACCVGLRQRP